VNTLNKLTSATRSGTLTVAGSATEPRGDVSGSALGVTNVTVSGTGLSSGPAEIYHEGDWARSGATLADGNNSYTASGQDTYGRTSQDSVGVDLPVTNTFVYDLNGNLCTNNTRIFDYDDENQLIRVTEPSVWKTEFTYDGLLRMRKRKEFAWSGSTWTQTNEVHYVYDGQLVIQERDGNNLSLVTYTRGNDLSGTFQGAGGIGGLLARTDNGQMIGGSPTATALYVADGNGNVIRMFYTNGTTAARYNYDPFGNMLTMSGPLAAVNKYRFSSKEWNGSAGLYYYGFRFYDPTLQRWLNRDPLGDISCLVIATAESTPWLDHDDDASDTGTQDEALQTFAEVNRNLQGFTLNSPLIHFDAFGLCDGEANPENVEAVQEALEAAEGDTQAPVRRSAIKKLQQSKLFGTGPEGSRVIDINKLKQLLNPDELRQAHEIAMNGIKKALQALKSPVSERSREALLNQLETQINRAQACTRALGN
jgi:RHS repeat-associated protein